MSSKTKPYHHGDLHRALLNAGQEILVQAGVNGLSLRKVARSVGVSPSAVYRHFSDKDALIAAIAAEGGRKLTEKLSETLTRSSDDIHAQINEMGWSYLQFGIENPDLLRIMFGGHIEGEKIQAQDAFALLVNLIRKGQSLGHIVKGNPFELAIAAWAMSHGLTMLIVENPIPHAVWTTTTKNELVNSCFQVLLFGVSTLKQN